MDDETKVIEAIMKTFSAKRSSLTIEKAEGITRGAFSDDAGTYITFKIIPDSFGALIDFSSDVFSGRAPKKLIDCFEYELEQVMLRNVKIEPAGSPSGLGFRLEY